MPQHSRSPMTMDERITYLELDMTAVHDALARLSDRLELVMQAVTEREQSHIDVLNAQVDQVDDMLAKLRDEVSPQAAPTEEPPAEAPLVESNEHGLLG